MPQYSVPVPKREDWQKLRDKNHVAKGATKVNMGASIERVHDSFSLATISKNQQATVQLLKDVDVYIAGITAKYPTFVPIVTTNVKAKAQNHKRFVDDVVKAKTEFYPRYAAVEKAWSNLEFRNGPMKAVKDALERLLGCAAAFAMVEPSVWDPKRQALNRVMAEFERAPAMTDALKTAFERVMRDLKP